MGLVNGQTLKEIRKSTGYRQQEVADLVFRSKDTYYKWENPDFNTWNLTYDEIDKLAALYKISPDDIIAAGSPDENFSVVPPAKKPMRTRKKGSGKQP